MAKVIDIKEARRKKKYGDPGDSLKGRGFPADMTFGPDDYAEPYEVIEPIGDIPEEVRAECPEWILKILNRKGEEA